MAGSHLRSLHLTINGHWGTDGSSSVDIVANDGEFKTKLITRVLDQNWSGLFHLCCSVVLPVADRKNISQMFRMVASNRLLHLIGLINSHWQRRPALVAIGLLKTTSNPAFELCPIWGQAFGLKGIVGSVQKLADESQAYWELHEF